MDGGAWWAAVHGVAKSRTQLSNFTFTFHFPALEKEMATHSSTLALRIPGMGEPGGLLSMGSHRVGHDLSDLAVAAVIIPQPLISFSMKHKSHVRYDEAASVDSQRCFRFHESAAGARKWHRPCMERVQLCANETLFSNTGGGLNLAQGL